ncbi:ABC transporter-like domain protein, partial [mine drainage metagenome]
FQAAYGIVGSRERTFQALARYGLVDAAERPINTLSGGQRARLEILGLELEGHNLLLLDEPTDNLDLDSADALEQALESFEGAILAVSHDRTFLRQMDRFLYLDYTGGIARIPDIERTLEVLFKSTAGESRR